MLADLHYGIMILMDKSYIAGFVDGEGYFGLFTTFRTKTAYQCAIKVGQTCDGIPVIEELQRRYGGYLQHRSPPNRKPSLHWELKGKKNIKPFLIDILPYLIVKKRQGILLLEYCEARQSHPLYLGKDRERELERKHEIYREIKALIAEGRPVATTK